MVLIFKCECLPLEPIPNGVLIVLKTQTNLARAEISAEERGSCLHDKAVRNDYKKRKNAVYPLERHRHAQELATNNKEYVLRPNQSPIYFPVVFSAPSDFRLGIQRDIPRYSAKKISTSHTYMYIHFFIAVTDKRVLNKL